MDIGFYHGSIWDGYEDQANKQGYTLGYKAELFDKIKDAYSLLRAHGYLTDSQLDVVCNKIQKDLVRSVRKMKSAEDCGGK